MSARALAIAVAALTAVPLATAEAGAKPQYTTQPSAETSQANLIVTYRGEGAWRTTFHAHPPNPDGHKDDKNDAHDSSRQTWAIRFRRALTVPTCGQPAEGSADPCASLTGLSGATGATSMIGRVDHKHVDGIYRQLDRTVKCRLRKATSARKRLETAIAVRYIPESQSIAVTAGNPLFTALSLFPTACPTQGDSIDRIADFYATPGFSFADGYDPDRWFTSQAVVIPAAAFRRSSNITIPLRNTPAGTPPRGCAVRDPSFERCKTGGSWRGTLTFTLKR